MLLAVSLDGEDFVMARGENRQEHVLALPQGKLKLAWELYRPNFGNTITITTGKAPLRTPLAVVAPQRKPQRQSAADLRAAMLHCHPGSMPQGHALESRPGIKLPCTALHAPREHLQVP